MCREQIVRSGILGAVRATANLRSAHAAAAFGLVSLLR